MSVAVSRCRRSGVDIQSVRFGQLLSINALYNERVYGQEEHATRVNRIPLKISHLFGFPVSNRCSQRESITCLRLESIYNIYKACSIVITLSVVRRHFFVHVRYAPI